MATHGVAIAIPEPWAAELSRVRSVVGDPMSDMIPPHVTLLPPTAVAEADLAGFVDHLEEVAASQPPFAMVLSGTASFRPISPVVFVQVSEGISSCERLEAAVRSGPVERDLDFNYHPHVTIAHHLPDAALDEAATLAAGFRASFEVTAFELFAQGADEVWRPQREFRLHGRRH